MEVITQNVVADFQDGGGFETLYAKQGDTERRIVFSFADRLTPYVVSGVSHVYWKEAFSDGMILLPIDLGVSGLSQDGKTLMVNLTPSMTAVAGVARCELSFASNDDRILTTHTFNLCIEGSVYDGGHYDEETSGIIDDLNNLIIEARQKIDVMTGLIAAAQGMDVAEAARVLAETRRESLNVGGAYEDEQGVTHTNVNEYEDIHGVMHTVSPSDFDGTSFMAIAGYARDTAQAAETALTQTESAVSRAESYAQSSSASATSASADAQTATTAAQTATSAATNASADAQTATTAAQSASTSAASASTSASDADGYASNAQASAASASASAANASQSAVSAAASEAQAAVDAQRAVDAMATINQRIVITVDNDGNLLWGVTDP